MASLRALECLIALIETGSVTEAAASLHLSQPALSHQIAALERELGTPVAQRLSRGVRPTTAGRAAAEHARVAVEAARRAVEAGRAVESGAGGRLRIACLETMTASLLVPVLREWRIERPEVQIDLEEFTSSDRMEEYLSSGQADFGVGLRPTATELVVEVLGREQIVVVCSPEHRFTRRDSIAVAELAKEPFVRYHHSNGVTDWVDQFAARHELSLSPVLRTRSPRTAAHLASAGMGVTIVPMSAITVRSGGTVRPFAPAVHRDVVALVAAPADSLARRFVTELARRGVPAAEELVAP